MTIAAERLAVIAAVTLPITALSSVMGMNVIVNTAAATRTCADHAARRDGGASSVLLLIWAKRHGWW